MAREPAKIEGRRSAEQAAEGWRGLAAFLSRYGIYCAFLLLAGLLSVFSPPFSTLSNVENILQQTSVNGIIAVWMTLVWLQCSYPYNSMQLTTNIILRFESIGNYPWSARRSLGIYCVTANPL